VVTPSVLTDEGGDMGPQDEKEFPFALTDLADHPASAVEDSPLPDVIVNLATASNTAEHRNVDSTTLRAETHISIGCQVVVPFFIAGMGMVGAGFYLDHVQVSLRKCSWKR
jgi:hypothetical protein